MGYGFYNKRTVDVSIHEIMRGLKLTDSVNYKFLLIF